MTLPILAWVVLLFSLGACQSAFAAKNATVQGAAVLRSAPDASSDSVENLQDGEPVQISNYPTQGFYKTRTASGQIGWVRAGSVSTQALPAPGNEDLDIPAPQENAPPAQAPRPEIPHEDVKSNGPTHYNVDEPQEMPNTPRLPFEIKVYGGVEKPNLSDVNAAVGSTLLNVMPYFGGQVGYPLLSEFYLVLRVDHLTASPSQANANYSLSSTPLMLGLEYGFFKKKKFFVQGSLLLGVALSTTLDETVPSQAPPNVTELSATSFTEMLQIDAGFDLNRWLALYGEIGYRFMKSESVNPDLIGNGGGALATSNIAIDLSGPFVGAGLAFRF